MTSYIDELHRERMEYEYMQLDFACEVLAEAYGELISHFMKSTSGQPIELGDDGFPKSVLATEQHSFDMSLGQIGLWRSEARQCIQAALKNLLPETHAALLSNQHVIAYLDDSFVVLSPEDKKKFSWEMVELFEAMLRDPMRKLRGPIRTY